LGVGGRLSGRGLKEEDGRTKDEDYYRSGNGPVLTPTFVMMAMNLHCPIQAYVRYRPMPDTHLWSLLKVLSMQYIQQICHIL
jgi:hypothetical protein